MIENPPARWIQKLALLATCLAFTVIVLGAYTRLSDSGLGCPDWPGCYGHLIVPQTDKALALAAQAFPDHVIEHHKAWPEMIHRYVASSLGFLIILITASLAWAYKKRPLTPHSTSIQQQTKPPLRLALGILLLVLFQGALGAFTVTMKLYPPVVMGHLLGGFTLITLLFLLTLRLSSLPIWQDKHASALAPSFWIGLTLLIMQIALGGWTAANYAATVCSTLPICQTGWSQQLDFAAAFQLFGHTTASFEYAPHLSPSAKITIHVLHRFGAILVTLVFTALIIQLWRQSTHAGYRFFAKLLTLLLSTQLMLGISNVVFHLPLVIAVLHNAVAALLVLTTAGLLYQLHRARGCLAEQARDTPALWRQYLELTKPKVVTLLMITAWVGMFLATEAGVPVSILVWGSLGLWFAMAGSATINHVVDQQIDAQMQRTQDRPVATGHISARHALCFAALLCGLSMLLLMMFVNTLTAFLTLLGAVGYAAVYTLYLKRATPQNIVIGGLAGALPPLLGWTAVTGSIHPHALLLVLIIFIWTPPHFWALAIHRRDEYAKVNIPMLPVTHGIELTKTLVFLYTILLTAVTLLPYFVHMSGLLYFCGAVVLNIGFMGYAWRLKYRPSAQIAMKTFGFSIVYLFALFIVLLVDHAF